MSGYERTCFVDKERFVEDIAAAAGITRSNPVMDFRRIDVCEL